MDRRAFITGMTGGLLAAPLAAEAQQVKTKRIGVLTVGGDTEGLSRSLLNLAERGGRASYPQCTAVRGIPT